MLGVCLHAIISVQHCTNTSFTPTPQMPWTFHNDTSVMIFVSKCAVWHNAHGLFCCQYYKYLLSWPIGMKYIKHMVSIPFTPFQPLLWAVLPLAASTGFKDVITTSGLYSLPIPHPIAWVPSVLHRLLYLLCFYGLCAQLLGIQQGDIVGLAFPGYLECG